MMCLKQKIDNLSRKEYEYLVPIDDAMQMFNDCPNKIYKNRYYIDAGNNLLWEIDVFKNNLNGLIIAEIQLPTADTRFDKPDWIGEEVTEDYRYLNSVLSVNGLPMN